MASIKQYVGKDGIETWRVRFRNDGASCSKTFPTQEEARQFGQLIDQWGARRALEFIKEPPGPARRNHGDTVAQCVERYIELRPHPGTRAAYTTWLNTAIAPTLGDIRINQLTRDQVQLWVNRQSASSATITRNRTLLSAALKAAIERGEITANPATGVKVPRTLRDPGRAPLTPPFTREEYELIVKAMGSRYRLIVELLGETGCRFGEAAALQPADIHLAAGTIHFHQTYGWQSGAGWRLSVTKTRGSDRVIRVKKTLLERLDLSGEFVFTSTNGLPVKINAFRGFHWRRALESSGLPRHRHGHPHDLRHAHATWLLDAGISLPAIQKRLGHADVMTTLGMYGHAGTDSEDRILAALD